MNTKRILMAGLLAAFIIAVAETILFEGILADAMSAARLLFLEPGSTALALAWELAGVVVAALAVGWIYREEPRS